MKNIRGENGVINLGGKLGFDSLILNPDDPFFYDNIEDGIKSTVRVLLDNGFKTYSSCQGHDSPEFSCRNVVIVLKENEILPWRAMISDLNIINSFSNPITYSIVDYKDDLKGFMVLIGSIFNLVETMHKQRCFEDAIPSLKKLYYLKSFDNVADFSDKNGHINTFSSV